MNVRELIEAAKNFQPTEAQVEAFVNRLNEREKEYEQKAWDSRVTNEMLERTYSI
jgi:phosphoglycolate phosphatase-like HAD superfamily hydrolase